VRKTQNERKEEEEKKEIEKVLSLSGKARGHIEEIKKATLYIYEDNPDEQYHFVYFVVSRDGRVRISHDSNELATFDKFEKSYVIKIGMKSVYDYADVEGPIFSVFEAAMKSKKLDDEINQEIDDWESAQMERIRSGGKLDTGMKEVRKKIIDKITKIIIGRCMEAIKELSLSDDQELVSNSNVYVVVHPNGNAKVGRVLGEQSLFALNVVDGAYIVKIKAKYTFDYSARTGYDFDHALINEKLENDIRNEIYAWSKIQKDEIEKTVD
jgi:hypothetical protein